LGSLKLNFVKTWFNSWCYLTSMIGSFFKCRPKCDNNGKHLFVFTLLRCSYMIWNEHWEEQYYLVPVFYNEKKITSYLFHILAFQQGITNDWKPFFVANFDVRYSSWLETFISATQVDWKHLSALLKLRGSFISILNNWDLYNDFNWLLIFLNHIHTCKE